MRCEEMAALFSDHVDGALPLDVEEDFCAHVATCAPCRRALLRYEQGVSALAGASPEPPDALAQRIRRAAVAEGLVGERAWPLRRWLLPVAAGLAGLALGVAISGRGSRDADARRAWPARVPSAACTSGADAQPWGDLDAFRAQPAAVSAVATVELPSYRVRMPRWLTSRGPYDSLASAATRADATLCVPLRAAYGERLMMTVAPAPASLANDQDEFVIQSDPTRVLYGRVTWIRAGLVWSLEGRAETSELLDLANELAARVAVENL